jgi:alpha-beta hydrolase superfamily lysophospholipase
MNFKFFITVFTIFSIVISAQEPEKITFKDTPNFYYKILPEGKPAGMIMVLPGGGETPERVMNQIYLDELG